jgi:mono/diheme cytochrome c family protein
MKNRRLVGWIVLGVTVLFALAPLLGEGDVSIPIHHLLHVALLFGAAVSALLLVSPPKPPQRGAVVWLLLAIVTPLLAMFMMWPSDYSIFERTSTLHSVQHLGLVILGFLTGYAGQRYAAGIGVVVSSCLWLMGILAAGGYGVSPPAPITIAQASADYVSSGSPAAPNAPTDGKGARIFAQNCAACHGARGRGGFGPALVNEGRRKNLAQAEAWIEHPAPPMPALYPGTLSEKDVHEVAEFVESLK